MSRFNGKRGRFSRFSLSASITPPVVYPVVTGGTLTSDDLFYYRTFYNTDYLNVSNGTLHFDALVVAGGGSGANYTGGGGGGGGAKLFESLTTAPGSLFIAIGAGGPGLARYSNSFGPAGVNGSSSEIYDTNWNVLANTYGGGGGGVYYTHVNGLDGGNGGGGGMSFDVLGVGGASVTDYGFYGANGDVNTNYGSGNSGGGGGAGASGSGKNGGNGIYLPDIAFATGTGIDGYYAGGGGGAGRYIPGGSGGLGGGTSGGIALSGDQRLSESAPQNSGGGSGGGGNTLYSPNGSGGSGIIIIRYLKSEVDAPAPVTTTVSGGTLFEGGDYYYRAFTSSDTLTISDGTLDAEVLVLAGGGGGANGYAGGGGSGGLIHLSNLSLEPGYIPVTVGAGGASWTYGGYGNGFNGSNTEFGSIATAIGGGFGAIYGNSGGSGGSGGGAGYFGGNGGSGIPGQGNDGSGNIYGGGAGGGYLTAGSGYEGGQGTAEFNDFGVATGTGKISTGGLRYYAAGGNSESSGNTDYGRTPGWTSAEPNTGCGGAGNGISLASGGSGIVILKYLKTSVA